MNRSIVCACIAALAGCGSVDLVALTVPPPGKVAQLDAENLKLELSRGVAFAFECNEANNDGYTGPCRDAATLSMDETIVKSFPSYLDELSTPAYDNGELGPRSRSAFVVVGLVPGSADLKLTTKETDLSVRVTVLP